MANQFNPSTENVEINSLSEEEILVEVGANTKDVVASSNQADTSNAKELNVDTHNDMK